MNKVINKLVLLIPTLFMFEMVFGYTGTLVMFGKVSIRVVMFLMTFLILYGHSLYYVIKNKIKIFDFKDKKSVLGSFNVVDWSFLLVFVSTLFSMLVVPCIFGGSVSLSLDEIRDTAAMMSLFFPISFLMKKKEINFSYMEKYIKVLVFGLAVLHIALYIGQSYDNMFLMKYFETVKNCLGGSGIMPPIILGNGGYTRIIYSTSIFLIIGIYLFFRNLDRLKLYDYAFFYLEVTAILTTMTKSIWLSMAIGIFIYTIGYSYVKFVRGQKEKIIKLMVILISTLVMVILLNFTMFSRMIGVRCGNMFVNSSVNESANEISEDLEELKENDAEGAKISNDIKIQQSKVLIDKWQQHPIVGWGYGSYAEDNIRSETSPFSYEMTFFALFMKTGIIGIINWGFLALCMIVYMYKVCNTCMEEFYAWMFLIISFVGMVQTNPFLFNFSGMGFLLIICLTCINKGILNCSMEQTVIE